jgi:hypothetical protein
VPLLFNKASKIRKLRRLVQSVQLQVQILWPCEVTVHYIFILVDQRGIVSASSFYDSVYVLKYM